MSQVIYYNRQCKLYDTLIFIYVYVEREIYFVTKVCHQYINI